MINHHAQASFVEIELKKASSVIKDSGALRVSPKLTYNQPQEHLFRKHWCGIRCHGLL